MKHDEMTKTLLDFVSHHLKCNKQWSSTIILNLSFQSQVLLIFIQWLLSGLIPDHIPDGVFQIVQNPEPESQTDIVIKEVFGTFERWDAAYFLYIAQYGYTFENTIAFFPLFPILVRGAAFCINHVTFYSLNSSSCFILSAFLINVVCFSLSTFVLYKIALKVSNNNFYFSSLVVLLFLFNPARVFFIAPYSESLFSLTTFLGILFLYDHWNFKSCIFFAFSVLTRSNGLLNVGFLVHKYICHIYKSYFQKSKKKISITFLAWELFCLFFAMGFIIAPFMYYQKYTRSLFCDPQSTELSLPEFIISHAKVHSYVLPGTSHGSYCNSFELPYSYVQRHYWRVGFLKYFQLKQIPNFLLATPILLLVFHASYNYFIECRKIDLLLNLQIFQCRFYTGKHFSTNCLASYYVHLFALSLFCFFCIHVQVSTRMLLSSSPLVYFIVAKYVTENHYLTNYCLLYFCSYCTVGLLLFTNHYPWT